uniref:Uncharacterized protein n=1 Tax=Rhabditophanes sp. KR3021 TaxID=114890 RepID=A0AC35UCB9_9BILA
MMEEGIKGSEDENVEIEVDDDEDDDCISYLNNYVETNDLVSNGESSTSNAFVNNEILKDSNYHNKTQKMIVHFDVNTGRTNQTFVSHTTPKCSIYNSKKSNQAKLPQIL